jgi:sugar lactone lactonase YvrE
MQTVQTLAAPDADAPRALFARFHDLAVRPHGAAIDAAGDHWTASVGGGGEICRFTPDGARVAGVATPMQSPTKVLIAGGRIFLPSRIDDSDGGRLTAWHGPQTCKPQGQRHIDTQAPLRPALRALVRA